MVEGISGSQAYNVNQPNDSITYDQTEQVEQNLETYIENLTPNSGQYVYALNLLEQIQGFVNAGPNGFNGAELLQDIQLGLNYSYNGKDIYLATMQGDASCLPAASQSQIQTMLNQIFSDVNPPPSFSVPPPTIADTTFITAFTELQQIPQSGADGGFRGELYNAMENITSGMSNTDLYNQLKGISTAGVDPSIVSWYNNFLANLSSGRRS